MKFEDSWENNTHQDVEEAIKDKVGEIEDRIDNVGESIPDAETIGAIQQAAQAAQDAAATVSGIVNENSGRVSHTKAPAVLLRFIHNNEDDIALANMAVGDVYADGGGQLQLVVESSGSKAIKNIGNADPGLIYYSTREEGFYRYNGSGVWVRIASSGDTDLSGYAELGLDGRLKHAQAPAVVLASIGSTVPGDVTTAGSYYCIKGSSANACKIYWRKPSVSAQSGYEDVELGAPQKGVIYYDANTDKSYVWTGTSSGFKAIMNDADLAGDGRLKASQATAVVLRYIYANLQQGDNVPPVYTGELFCNQSNQIIAQGGVVNPDIDYQESSVLPAPGDANLGSPDPKLVYYDVNKQGFYRFYSNSWHEVVISAPQGETVVINSDGANINDSHSNSVLTAPSSRLEKELYLNLKALYDNLAGIAFSGTAPQWQTVAAPKYTISAGTLTNVTATYNGSALPASNVAEGEVTVVLTPATGMALSESDIHIVINNDDVPFTLSGNNVTFVLCGNATISASASAGVTVNQPASTDNYTIDKTSVRLNTADETVQLSLKEHCSWGNPVNVSVLYGSDNITSQCTIEESSGKQVITLPTLTDGSKSLTITASASLNSHITVTFPSNHDNMFIKHGNDELTGDSVVVYSDMLDYAITFQAKDGHVWSLAPQATGGGTMTHSGNVYTLTVGTSDTSNITVAATTQPIPTYDITLPSTNVTAEILQGGAGAGKVYGGEVIVKLTPDEGYSVSVDSITMGNLNPSTLVEGTGYDVVDSSGVKTLTIYNVTGNITITVTVATVSRHTITLPSNMTMNAGDDETELSGEQTVTDGDSFECYFKVNKEVPSNNNKYNNDEPNGVVVMMGSEDITATAYNYKTGKITINEVRGNVVITATPITFTERRFIGSSGSESDQYSDKTYSYCDYLEVPDGVKTVVVSYGVATGSSDSRYTAFYDDNKANPTATRVKTMYKSITVPSGAKFIRSSFKVSETGGVRDYSLRRTRYILGIKNDDSTVYIYKGDGYDGRYEDMGLEFDKKSNASNSISSSDGFAITKLIEIPQDCVSIKAMLGAYSGDAPASQTICFFDSNKSFISGAGAAANTEATIAVPTGAIYLRASMHGIDNCYIKDDTNDDYIFKGLSVQ